ncbi:glutamyl-tRNA reductase [Acetivibrio cellulolyticus]|uniref:glutamyl-tRNA reductase n=1 Tax=Acetivibrio cellulolyticus TaxID=35830 RepID=UPI0001E2CC06|nr:glutamyl-tRNA reductase [Acetivibrio cellulolyticus]
MNIIMAGIDYHCASVEIREKVGFVPGEIRKLLTRMKEKSSVSGVAMVSTCNRTEVYFSYDQCENIDPVGIFCDAAELNEDEIKKYFYIKNGEAAVVYLFELACGIHSMIFGEDQIITQVKGAICIANEVMASDAILNTLFRCAVTCAKKVKTSLVLSTVSPSVASQTVQFLSDYLSNNRKSRALVIGNGIVGRKVCEELLMKKCEVFLTLRQYHKIQNIIIPSGCKTINYDERCRLLSQIDILISATSSPHQTITYDMIRSCSPRPRYIIDLAVPRDIDPEVKNIEGIIYCNIDTLGEIALKDNTKEIAAMRVLIEDHMEKFKKWIFHREKFLSDCYRN